VPSSGKWEFPKGTVLVKHFRLGERLMETRLFVRHPDGVWADTPTIGTMRKPKPYA
jgi:hypothetical protein